MAFVQPPFFPGRSVQNPAKPKRLYSCPSSPPSYTPPTCRAVRVSVPVRVEAPRSLVYETFSDLGRMGEWSACLETVRRDDIDTDYSEWTFSWRGVRLSWRAKDGERKDGEIIAWQSVNGLKHVGCVTFEEMEKGTKVTMDVEYDLASLLANVAEMPAVSNFVQRALEEELKRFRRYTLRMYRRQLVASGKPST